jgi:hypothetical protein
MSATQALKAARDAGIILGVDCEDLILEASATPPAAILDLLSRKKAEVLALLRATARQSTLPPPTPSLSNAPQLPEPGLEEPCAARRGRVQEINGALLHFCVECGRFGAFGYGVNLRAGRQGRGYCREHWPKERERRFTANENEKATTDYILSEKINSSDLFDGHFKKFGARDMTLEQIQSELRAISGTPVRNGAESLRRCELWRRLDALCAASSLNNQEASDAGRIGEQTMASFDSRRLV